MGEVEIQLAFKAVVKAHHQGFPVGVGLGYDLGFGAKHQRLAAAGYAAHNGVPGVRLLGHLLLGNVQDYLFRPALVVLGKGDLRVKGAAQGIQLRRGKGRVGPVGLAEQRAEIFGQLRAGYRVAQRLKVVPEQELARVQQRQRFRRQVFAAYAGESRRVGNGQLERAFVVPLPAQQHLLFLEQFGQFPVIVPHLLQRGPNRLMAAFRVDLPGISVYLYYGIALPVLNLENNYPHPRQVSHNVGLIMVQQVDVMPHNTIVRQRGLKLVKKILLPGINAVSPVA